MSEENPRITDPEGPPSLKQLETLLGPKAWNFWIGITDFIAHSHPGVFEPEWLYGGKKHGWSRRYKKSKSYCTLVPEKGNLLMVIVFGAKERDQVVAIMDTLSQETREAYHEATTYHDGKWLRLTVDNETVVRDIEKLLAVKRRPKRPGGSTD